MMLGVTTREDGLEGEGGSAEQSSRVQAVVSFFGPTDLLAADLPPVTDNILKNFLGGPKAEKADAARKASPVTYVRKDAAPMLLFQGTADPLVPATQAYKMADAMTKAGVPGRVEILVGLGHGWTAPNWSGAGPPPSPSSTHCSESRKGRRRRGGCRVYRSRVKRTGYFARRARRSPTRACGRCRRRSPPW